MGNFKIISLGAGQMISVYSPKCLLTSPCMEGSSGSGGGNHCFNSFFHQKTDTHAYIPKYSVPFEDSNLIALRLSLLNRCYSTHKHLSISELLMNLFSQQHNSLATSGSCVLPTPHMSSKSGW